MPAQNRLTPQQFHRRRQIVGQLGQPAASSSATPSSNSLDDRDHRRPAGGAQFRCGGIGEDRARRRHLIQLVQEPVDRRGLLRRVGDEVAHHVACAMHGLGAEALPQLANELLAQQLNLLTTLGFDAFQFGIGMGPQLLGDLSAS